MIKTTYTEIVERVSLKTGLSKQAAHDTLKDFIELIEVGLQRDGHVTIKALGSFRIKKVAERKGVNPRTGDPIVIPAHNKVVFRPDPIIKQRLNKGRKTMKNNEKPKISIVDYWRSSRPVQIASAVAAVLLIVVFVLSVFKGGNDQIEEVTVEKMTVETGIVEAIELTETEPLAATDLPLSDQTPIKEAKAGEQKVEQVTSVKSGTTHLIKKGENLWSLAAKHYGDPYLWPLIYQANRDVIKNPDVLKPGASIVFPVLDEPVDQFTGKVTGKDRENLAIGNLLAFQAYKTYGKVDFNDFYRVANRLAPEIVKKHMAEMSMPVSELASTKTRD
ncbi:MAG: HU family DNA-binding protein [Candidatus Neomarinimicrobiota bacterium]